MNKRYSLKLGVGLMSLVAASAAGQAAQARADANGTEQSFALAMADAADQDSTPATPAPASVSTPAAAPVTVVNGRVSQKLLKDGLPDGGAYVEADRIENEDIKDSDGGILHAYGSVLMRYKGQIIRADEVTYNSVTHVTTASGHAQTINDDGSVTFSDVVSYNDNGQTGIGENVASIGKDNAKVFARRVEQLDVNTNRLTDVIYTPCQLCVKDDKTQPPTWSIEAGRITQRHDKKMVYYNDATVKLHGVPVLYSPYLWTPDPELERASGFLQPRIGASKKRGFSYEQPYLWSISAYSNLIVSPQLNSDVNPLVNLAFNRHFYSGELHVRYGFTSEAWFDNHANRFGPRDFRDYLLADGDFKINDDWRWAFTAQHVQDKNTSVDNNPYLLDVNGNQILNGAGNPVPNSHYGKVYGDNANFFERYSIEDAFDPVGEIAVDARQLVNQVNLTRQTENAYFAVTMANFQSLQIAGYEVLSPLVQRAYVTSSDTFPVIAPQIEAYWSPKSRILGGQAMLSFNAIGISHKLFPSSELVDAPLAADGTSGFDTARASAGFSYTGSMTTRSGLRWGPFIEARADYYHLSDLDAAGTDLNVSRQLGTVGFNFSLPLYRKFNNLTATVEPVVQLAVSPETQRDPNIPNEDSQSFEFDDTTLFTANKSPGFDIYEGGARLNLGLRTRLQFNSGLKIETLVGRTLRDKPESQFLKTVTIGGTDYNYDPYGIGSKSSDWIIDGSFDTGKGLYGYARTRLDSDSLRPSQGEFGLSTQRPNTTATIRYVWNDVLTGAQISRLAQPVVNGKLQRFGDNYRDIQIYAQHFFTKNWGVGARIDRDMVDNKWRRSQVSLIYKDDCSWFEFVYQRNDSVLTQFGQKPQSTFLFRLNLTTLGTTGTEVHDVR